MSRYCPTCFCEYTDDVKTCPEDGQVLLRKKPKPPEPLVDLYAAYGILEAERVADLLEEKGILAHETTDGISQMPVENAMSFIICVKKEDIKAAKEIIEQLRSDGVISKNGTFL